MRFKIFKSILYFAPLSRIYVSHNGMMFSDSTKWYNVLQVVLDGDKISETIDCADSK